ncbi:MAG: hypothetical protein U0359_31325 [Byssovorax sp.]
MRHASLRGILLTLGSGAFVALAAFAGACSSSGTGGSGTTGGTCPDNLVKAEHQEFCEGGAPAVNCDLVTGQYTDQICGVALKTPEDELKRSATVKEYAGSGPPKISCFDPASYPAKPDTANSQKVQVSGIAKIFSHGCESKNLKIEIFTVKRGGGADDGMPDQLVGNALTTSSDCKVNGVESEEMDCGKRYECNYIYNGVPTETELMIKTSGDLWASLYDYNVYIPNAEVMNGVYKHDVRALASDDYNVISQAAIGVPVTSGHGAIAGEVHDCGDVRLQNATVEVDQQRKIMTYFTSDEDHPLPDTAARATSILGLYAAIDVNPGPVTVAAMGKVDGKNVTVGYFKLQVFPDSVSAVTFRGLRPFQVP